MLYAKYIRGNLVALLEIFQTGGMREQVDDHSAVDVHQQVGGGKEEQVEVVSGQLCAVSQLLYLSGSSRVFIVRLAGAGALLCSVSPSLPPRTRNLCRALLLAPPLGHTLTASRARRVPGLGREVWQLTRHSTLTLQPAPQCDLTPTRQPALISYRGVVTASRPALGCFTLDKTVKVCGALLAGVTNLSAPAPGTSLTVHQAHLARYRGQRWLVCCGAARLQLEEEEGRVHPNSGEREASLSHPVVELVQQPASCWDLLSLLTTVENYTKLELSLGSEEPGLARIMRAALLQPGDGAEEGGAQRSLVREFVQHSEACWLESQQRTTYQVRQVSTMSDVVAWLENNLTEGEELEFPLHSHLVAARLQFDKAGRVVVQDRTGICLVEGQEWEGVTTGTVLLLQTFTGRRQADQLLLTVSSYQQLAELEPPLHQDLGRLQLGEAGTGEELVVVGRGGLVTTKTGTPHYLVLCTGQQGRLVLRLAGNTSFHLVRPGRRLVVQADQLSPAGQGDQEQFQIAR